MTTIDFVKPRISQRRLLLASVDGLIEVLLLLLVLVMGSGVIYVLGK